jgi:hypothetical protein
MDSDKNDISNDLIIIIWNLKVIMFEIVANK